MSSDVTRPRISGLRKLPNRSPTPASEPAGNPAVADTTRVGKAAVRIPALDLKLVQRRAYERGRAQVIEEAGSTMAAAVSTLEAAAADLIETRKKDREALVAFSVDLACALAEELLLMVVDREEHDVRGMARRVLDQVMPEAGGSEIRLEGNPEDLALLTLPEGAADGGGVRLVPCPALPRGSFRARTADMDYRAGLKERLAAMRAALQEGVRDGVS
jgi:hypothetical protein